METGMLFPFAYPHKETMTNLQDVHFLHRNLITMDAPHIFCYGCSVNSTWCKYKSQFMWTTQDYGLITSGLDDLHSAYGVGAPCTSLLDLQNSSGILLCDILWQDSITLAFPTRLHKSTMCVVNFQSLQLTHAIPKWSGFLVSHMTPKQEVVWLPCQAHGT